MVVSNFSSEEIAYLVALPAVSGVLRGRISYTRQFREECMRRYERGDSPVRIFREAGLGPELIGYKRIERCISRWKTAAASGKETVTENGRERSVAPSDATGDAIGGPIGGDLIGGGSTSGGLIDGDSIGGDSIGGTDDLMDRVGESDSSWTSGRPRSPGSSSPEDARLSAMTVCMQEHVGLDGARGSGVLCDICDDALLIGRVPSDGASTTASEGMAAGRAAESTAESVSESVLGTSAGIEAGATVGRASADAAASVSAMSGRASSGSTAGASPSGNASSGNTAFGRATSDVFGGRDVRDLLIIQQMRRIDELERELDRLRARYHERTGESGLKGGVVAGKESGVVLPIGVPTRRTMLRYAQS